jgi:hypothetical protein
MLDFHDSFYMTCRSSVPKRITILSTSQFRLTNPGCRKLYATTAACSFVPTLRRSTSLPERASKGFGEICRTSYSTRSQLVSLM